MHQTGENPEWVDSTQTWWLVTVLTQTYKEELDSITPQHSHLHTFLSKTWPSEISHYHFQKRNTQSQILFKPRISGWSWSLSQVCSNASWSRNVLLKSSSFMSVRNAGASIAVVTVSSSHFQGRVVGNDSSGHGFERVPEELGQGEEGMDMVKISIGMRVSEKRNTIPVKQKWTSCPTAKLQPKDLFSGYSCGPLCRLTIKFHPPK